MKKIRVGIVGAGGIARGKHLPGHRNVEGVEVIAVCDIIEEKARKFAEDEGIRYYFKDWKKLVEMDEIDAISVCTPNNYHAAPSIEAMLAGKHVLCEKPMAGNAKDALAMCETAKKTGKILQVGVQSRFVPEWRNLRLLREEGLFGEIYHGEAMAVRRRGIPVSLTFISKEQAGGGSLIDIGVHSLDLLLYIIGYQKPIKVLGQVERKFGNRENIVNEWGSWNPKDFTVEDWASGEIHFENGLVVTLKTAWASHIEAGPSWFIGTKAGAKLSSPPIIYTDIYINKVGKHIEYTPIIPESIRNLPGEFESFHEAIRKNLPSPVPPEELLITQKIFDAIYCSAKTGKAVRIK